MELEILETGKDRITFQLKGAGHTFCNNLKKELYNDKNVTVAAYKVVHPLIGTPTFILEKKGNTSFSRIISNAAARTKKQNKEFMTAFKKAAK